MAIHTSEIIASVLLPRMIQIMQAIGRAHPKTALAKRHPRLLAGLRPLTKRRLPAQPVFKK